MQYLCNLTMHMTVITAVDIALYAIPVMLGIIGWIVKRGIARNDANQDATVEMMGMLKDSINSLKIEISKMSVLGDSRQTACDERMGRIYGELAAHDNILDIHANKLQDHEVKIAKLEKK